MEWGEVKWALVVGPLQLPEGLELMGALEEPVKEKETEQIKVSDICAIFKATCETGLCL